MLLDLTIQQSSTDSFSSFNTVTGDDDTEGELSTMMAIKSQPVAASRKTQLHFAKSVPATPVIKNKTDLPVNLFTRFLSSLTSSHADNDQSTSATPIANGVFAIQTSLDEMNTLPSSPLFAPSSSSPPTCDRGCNNQSIEVVWLPSIASNHNKGLHSVVRRLHRDIFKPADDRKLLHMIMERAEKLPQTSGKYACNHIMVNAERIRKRIPPLTRYRDLDRVAREHARTMADEKMVRHMDGPNHLQARILERKEKENSADRPRLFFPRLGVNVARGKNVEVIHKEMMANLAERNNVLDKRFTALGMGTARADDGMIYLCQIFGG